MVDLEDRFEKFVLKRREDALAGLPPIDQVRPPLKRPEIIDDSNEIASLSLSKNGRKRVNPKKISVFPTVVLSFFAVFPF